MFELWKQQFIDKYLENADRLSTQKLDMVIELAGTEVNCVVETLTQQLTELFKVQGTSKIPVSCEYLLDNLNLHLCKKSDPVLFDQLFDLLKKLPDEKMRWTFELFQKSIKDWEKGLVHSTSEAEQSTSPIIVSRCNTIQNLYHDIDMNMTLDQLLDWLAVSETVTNYLMAIEAVGTWNQYNRDEQRNIPHIEVSLLYRKLKNMAEKRNWSPLPSQLSKYSISIFFGRNQWSNLDLSQFCSSPEDNSPYHLIGCVDTCVKPLSTVLSKEAKMIFHFKHPSVSSCTLPGECGFILKTVPSEAALWTLRLCTEKEDYLNEQVHFHDEFRAEDMYVFFNEIEDWLSFNSMFPLSWLGGFSADKILRWEFNRNIGPNSRFKVLYKFM